MSQFKHLRVTWSSEVPVSAERFVEAAADWTGLMKYLPPDHPFKFVKVDTAPGSEEGKLPLTRRMWPDKSTLSAAEAAAIPDYFSETLMVVDREALTLIYSVGDGPLGMRNYYASKEVEVLGPNRCRATIYARFDLPVEVAEESVVPVLHEVYKGVILGIGLTVGSPRPAAALRSVS